MFSFKHLHKTIIHLTCMIFCSISTYLFHILSKHLKKWQRAYEQEMPPSWINYFTTSDWKIPRGPTEIDVALKHVITDANMLCRLFDDCKYMDIYLSIHQEYCYLGKQKISLYFSASTCEHLWPSPSNLVNCAKCPHSPSKDAADWSVVADLKVY